MTKKAGRHLLPSGKGQSGDLTPAAYLEISARLVTPTAPVSAGLGEDSSQPALRLGAEQPAQVPSAGEDNPTASAVLGITTVGGTFALGTTVPAGDTHLLLSIVAIPVSVVGAVTTSYIGARYAINAVDWFLGLAGLELALPTAAVFRICRPNRPSRCAEGLPESGSALLHRG